MNLAQVKELVLQSLEHERCGVKLYQAALECARLPELQDEWQEYLTQTRSHVAALEDVCKALGIDAAERTPGRAVAHHLGSALILAIKMARSAKDPQTAQLIAAECIVLSETKGHLDWDLLSQCADQLPLEQARVLRTACAQIEAHEDAQLYHTKAWCRELWSESLGLYAAPPQRRFDSGFVSAAAEQAAE